MPRLARSLLTLIGWCSKKRRALRSAIYSCKFSSVGKKSYYHQNFLNIASNMQVESSATPLSKDSQIRHVFHLSYTASIDKLIQQVKLNRCDGCSKRQQKRYFKRFVSCTCLRNASSYPLQQLLSFLTINVMRHLYPVSILLYAALQAHICIQIGSTMKAPWLTIIKTQKNEKL